MVDDARDPDEKVQDKDPVVTQIAPHVYCMLYEHLLFTSLRGDLT